MVERKAPTINDITSFKRRFEKKYKIKKMLLFGSLARGEAKDDSDADLIVVSDIFKGQSHLKRPVKIHLDWDLRYPVDFICYTLEEFEKLKKRVSIVREALREGIEIN